MKKLFVAVLAIAAAVACNTAEVVDLPQGPAIQFENAFVQNATRVGTYTNTLEAFDVWAYIDNKGGVVLVDEDVTKGNGQWGYANLQYWAPGHNYYFTALAPMNSANWDYNQAADVVTFTNVDGTEDLLYAYKEVGTQGLTLGGSMEAVKLNFAHLLSKVNFTFTNGFATDNVSVAIKGVEMTAVKNAEVTLAGETATWSNNVDTDLTLAFGDVANLASAASAKSAELLTIPTASDYVYGIKFYVDVYFGTVKAIDNHEFESTLTGIEFAQGKAYNLAATINAENLKMPVIEFDVNEVAEWVNQDINAGVIGSEIVVVDTIEKLQAALDAATGNTAIAVGADLAGNVTVPELKNATIAINGNGYKFDGTFVINGKSTYGQGTTLIENFAFETADNASFAGSKDAFIYCGEHEGTNLRYPDNVVVKDCTFKGTEATVGIKFWSLKGDLVVENCSADGLHSLMQLTSCGTANVLVDGAAIANGKNGISLQYAGNTVIKNSTIKAREYGIRADGCVATTNIEGTTIEANQPIVVRKMKAGNNYVVNVDAASSLVAAGDYQVIFTTGSDDAAYVAPAAGTYTLNAPAGTLYFPAVPAYDALVADATELNAALADSAVSTIVLAANGEFGTIVAKSNKTIIALDGAKVDAVVLNGSNNVTLKNIAFDAANAVIGYDGSGKSKTRANIVNDNNAGSNTPNKGASNIVIDGCVFTGAFANGGASIAFTDQSRSGGFTGNVTVKNCTFETTGAYYNIYGHYCGNSLNGCGDFVIENNTFNTTFTSGGPVYLGRYASSVPVVVKGNAFKTVSSLEEAVYVQDHSNYGVSVDASDNTFAL